MSRLVDEQKSREVSTLLSGPLLIGKSFLTGKLGMMSRANGMNG